MLKFRFSDTFQLGKNALRQDLTELDPPLVKRIDVPDHPLSEDRVFIKRDQLAERLRCQPLCKNSVRWPIAFADTMRNQPVRSSLGLELLRGLTKGQRFRLSKEIRHQQVVMMVERV